MGWNRSYLQSAMLPFVSACHSKGQEVVGVSQDRADDLPVSLVLPRVPTETLINKRLCAFRFPHPTAEELEERQNICIICREDMTPESATKLPCAHALHISCLRKLLTIHEAKVSLSPGLRHAK